MSFDTDPVEELTDYDAALHACDADLVQVSFDRRTLWVHARDGSTVGRFSVSFGLDVHTPATAQMAGGKECLHCVHRRPTQEDWLLFCDLIQQHFSIDVDRTLIQIPACEGNTERHTGVAT